MEAKRDHANDDPAQGGALRIAYFGIPEHLLWLLSQGITPVMVVLPNLDEDHTDLALSELQSRGIPMRLGHRIGDERMTRALASTKPDVLLSMHFDKRIPDQLLEVPRLCAVNVHPSLLPAYRGANPYFWVIRNGEKRTGVTSHFMEASFDTGPILVRREVPLTPGETLGTLWSRLGTHCREVALETLEGIGKGTLTPQPQPAGEDEPTAPRVRRRDLRLNLNASTEEVLRHIRAASPFFGVMLPVGERSLVVYRSSPVPKNLLPDETPPAGTILQLPGGRHGVATTDGVIYLDEVGTAGRDAQRLSPNQLARFLEEPRWQNYAA